MHTQHSERAAVDARDTISEHLIEQVAANLTHNRRVRRALADGGRLFIERQVPFLCLYRIPAEQQDEGTRRLVMGEASYLIASGAPAYQRGLAALVARVVTTLAGHFGAFLLLELWAAPASRLPPHGEQSEQSNDGMLRPGFRIFSPPHASETLGATVVKLEQSLQHVRISDQSATVEVVAARTASPPGMGPLLSATTARTTGCWTIGLEVLPIYRDPQQGTLYPLALQSLHRSVARALKQSCFAFVRQQTSYRPAHYHALGRKALVKAVWQIDRQLADVSDAFDFLLLATPINTGTAWAHFKRSGYAQTPAFSYRPCPVDPMLLKRRLAAIPIERVEDPSLLHLFLEKQRELDQYLDMLLDRGTPRFLSGSLWLFGGRDERLLAVANDIIAHIPPHVRDDTRAGTLDAVAFARRAAEEIAYYREHYPPLDCTVTVRDDIGSGLMVSHGNLLIGAKTRIPAARVEPLLHHEIGTHMVTYVNGAVQPFRQLHIGLAGHEELQEGLAVLAEYLGGALSRPRLRLLAARVVAAHCCIEQVSFVETYRLLTHTHQFEPQTAFTITMRIYRGGGLTKDMVYLRGLLALLEYLTRGGDVLPLFVGKIATTHIPLIRELNHRGILREPPLVPRYMRLPTTENRLALLRNGATVFDLIERSKL